MTTTKPCKKCGGLARYETGRCVACQQEYSRRYQSENKDKRKPISPEKKREENLRWREANLDKARETNRRWRADNPERVREDNRQWREANPNRAKELNSQWIKAHPEATRARRQSRRARKTSAGGSFTASEWKTLVAQYDGHCCYPGCERTDLHADHVIPIIKGGTSDISNIQPLCEYHNLSKGTGSTDYRHKGGIVAWIQRMLFG